MRIPLMIPLGWLMIVRWRPCSIRYYHGRIASQAQVIAAGPKKRQKCARAG
jgi:hypothetical protein